MPTLQDGRDTCQRRGDEKPNKGDYKCCPERLGLREFWASGGGNKKRFSECKDGSQEGRMCMLKIKRSGRPREHFHRPGTVRKQNMFFRNAIRKQWGRKIVKTKCRDDNAARNLFLRVGEHRSKDPGITLDVCACIQWCEGLCHARLFGL